MHPARQALRRATAAAIALAISAPVFAHGDHPQGRSLLSPSSETQVVPKAAAVDRTVVRQRPIAVDLAAMERQSNAREPLTLEFFDGTSLVIVATKVESRGQGNFTYFGKVRGNPKSEAILTVVGGHLTAMITLQEPRGQSKAYRVESQPGIGHWLQELDPHAYPADHPPGSEALTAPPGPKSMSDPGPSKGEVDLKADTGDFIDLLVVYSNQTATAAGTAISSQIQAAIDAANTSFANSGIKTRLRLAYHGPAHYDESGDFQTDLNRLRYNNDGHMDAIHTLRDSYAADLVSMFIENGTYCGIGNLGPSASAAFTVVNRGCATGNYSFAHEIGHNFGARHDTYVDASTSPYAYGHGYAYTTGKWRTVMAYNNACTAAGTSCTRVGYWSNPNVLYGGVPMGTSSSADNARVFNANAYTVANFRVSNGTPGCTYALSPASASIAYGGGSGSTTVTSGSGCAWNATPSASWITVGAGSGTSGNGTLSFTVAANSGATRTGSIAIGNQTLQISQGTGCTYTVTPTSATSGAGGGSGTASVSTSSGCTWTASSGASWLTITSGASGTGSGTLAYSIASNSGSMRTGNLVAASKTVTVTQDAAAAAAPTSAATLSATSLSFGSVQVGKTSSWKSVTYTNSGTTPLTVSVSPSGNDAVNFAFAGCHGASLAPGASCTLQVQYKPTVAASHTAVFALGSAAPTQSLTVSGTGKSRVRGKN